MSLQREQLVAMLGTGREHAISANDLSYALNISTREVGAIVADLIEDGYCIGSLCGERHGYFLVRDAEDLTAGVAHIVHRAAASFARVRALQRNYERMPNHEQTSLFAEFDEAVSA